MRSLEKEAGLYISKLISWVMEGIVHIGVDREGLFSTTVRVIGIIRLVDWSYPMLRWSNDVQRVLSLRCLWALECVFEIVVRGRHDSGLDGKDFREMEREMGSLAMLAWSGRHAVVVGLDGLSWNTVWPLRVGLSSLFPRSLLQKGGAFSVWGFKTFKPVMCFRSVDTVGHRVAIRSKLGIA